MTGETREKTKVQPWAWVAIVVGLLLLYVFVVQGKYVAHESAEGSVCKEWREAGKDTPSECDEGFFGSFADILVGDASTAP